MLLERETNAVSIENTDNNHKRKRKNKITKKERENSFKNLNWAIPKKISTLKHKEKTIKVVAIMKNRGRLLLDNNIST